MDVLSLTLAAPRGPFNVRQFCINAYFHCVYHNGHPLSPRGGTYSLEEGIAGKATTNRFTIGELFTTLHWGICWIREAAFEHMLTALEVTMQVRQYVTILPWKCFLNPPSVLNPLSSFVTLSSKVFVLATFWISAQEASFQTDFSAPFGRP